MAKFEGNLRGSFSEILATIDREILSGSISATLEDQSDFYSRKVRCAVRVYERYSMWGGNRLSLSITLLDDGERIFISAITAGGSQAVLFKVNTFGEDSFLSELYDIVKRYHV